MRKKYIIKGLVQGIGYRPFVAKIADELNIDGWVRNTGGIVTVAVDGDEEKLNAMYQRLSVDVPTGGFVTSIDVEDYDEQLEAGFKIIESDADVKANLPLIPADIATCPECEKELMDPNNRRYKHPFISCTVCGPRYSIIERLPYDRDTITMADFPMCPKCEAEYTGKTDRRRHAQTIACKECGPKLTFNMVAGDEPAEEDAIDKAIAVLKNGGIVAVKDIGGYHLACNPFDSKAVANLRALKHREAKAFAVMFESVDDIKKYCTVSAKEQELLESPARPIVLLNRIYEVGKTLSDNVCLTSPSIGAMLPCNPVQIMLAKACGPLIMTSGNASGDVLETDDEKMIFWMKDRSMSSEMSGVDLAVLSHNRRILRPMDDSVMKVVKGRQQFIRRARGYVPNPIPVDIDDEIFAAGGDLKSSFCYIKNNMAYVSQYLGDMESVSCQQFYKNEKAAMKRIFGFEPKGTVVDAHPGYFSSKLTEGQKIQHHKAHVASVIAEHHLKGKVLGFAFDGTGYGDDGSIWGSETFLWNEKEMKRVAHLKPMKLIGGDAGAKNCDTILAGMLTNNNIVNTIVEFSQFELINAAIKNNINTITSTSMGRLFDAVSAMLDVCHFNSYEGQAPIELENLAATSSIDRAYPLHIGSDGDTKELFEGILDGLSKDIDKAEIARGFINAVADYILAVAKANQSRLDRNKQIVLSGGTFLNRILLERTIDILEAEGFNVYTAQLLPPGDGGICLGQAYLAAVK